MAELLASLRLCVFSLVVCAVAYPAAVWGFAALAAPESRQGSLLRDSRGQAVGSRLLAQNFTQPKYFWPRPSAANYDASATGGSNLSPTSPLLTERAGKMIARLQLAGDKLIPADLVTASGSGMDPHITRPAATIQAPRVAAARGMSLDKVEMLIEQHIQSQPWSATAGSLLVNVLELNVALDRHAAQQ